ncbi:3042_t:CDS:2 [Rhizophagus irregularis]|nr:3042_t:CDS:2 [Rhizophagus irregularis]
MSIHEYFDHNIQSAVPLRLSRCLKLWVEPVLDIKAQLILGLVDVWESKPKLTKELGTINGTGTTFGVELFASKKKEIKRQTYFLVEKV